MGKSDLVNLMFRVVLIASVSSNRGLQNVDLCSYVKVRCRESPLSGLRVFPEFLSDDLSDSAVQQKTGFPAPRSGMCHDRYLCGANNVHQTKSVSPTPLHCGIYCCLHFETHSNRLNRSRSFSLLANSRGSTDCFRRQHLHHRAFEAVLVPTQKLPRVICDLSRQSDLMGRLMN